MSGTADASQMQDLSAVGSYKFAETIEKCHTVSHDLATVAKENDVS